MIDQSKPEVQNVYIPVHSSLPLSPKMQSALLGHLIIDEKLYQQVSRRIQSNWFVNAYHGKVYKILNDVTKMIGRPPNRVELENSSIITAEDTATRNKIITTITVACIDAGQIRWDAIKPELTEWLKSKILQETILKSAAHWNKGQWHDTAKLMQLAANEYREAQFDEGIEVSFDNLEESLANQKLDRDRALTTGLPLLDSALLDNATAGGLLRGDTTIVMAPVNAGKTSTLITMARHNIFRQHNVLLMTHEGRPESIRNNMVKSCLDCSEEQLLNMYHTPEGIEKLRIVSALLKQHLTYIPYNKAGMKVEDAVTVIRRAQEDRITKTGKGYDLLVVDYPAKLTTEQAKSSLAMRNVLDIVYDFYVQLALEYNFHSLLAIQTNREGSKVNNGLNTNRLLTKEDVQEAWGPIASASNVITLNRSPTAKKKKRLTYYVDKSRSSDTGRAVVVRTNFAHCLTHSATMGATSYIGTNTYENKVDEWLVNYPNQEVPGEHIR